jgi:hypothetical protein
LPSSDRVGQDFGRFLDTLEELVAFVGTSSGFLIGVMLEDLFAMGTLNLILGGAPSITGYAKNSIVILRLRTL